MGGIFLVKEPESNSKNVQETSLFNLKKDKTWGTDSSYHQIFDGGRIGINEHKFEGERHQLNRRNNFL